MPVDLILVCQHDEGKRLMKLLVLGATGGTGLEIVRKALARGHTVTAFVRSPEKLKYFEDRITIKVGDLFDNSELQSVVKGQDAVLSSFGPKLPIGKKDSKIMQRFARDLTASLPPAGVKRVVIQSSAFMFKNAILPPAYIIGRMLYWEFIDDEIGMERIIRDSVLDWTIIRPSRLINKPYTGKYRMLQNKLPNFGFSIPRADVAECMVKHVENKNGIEKIYGVSS
jgi:putative NADH-flavin reductase